MDLPRIQPDPRYPQAASDSQRNGNINNFYNDLEDGELRPVSPPSRAPPPLMGVLTPPIRASLRGHGKKNKAKRGRGNPGEFRLENLIWNFFIGSFGPPPPRFQLPPEQFFPSPQPPRMFSRFMAKPLPSQEISFAQRGNFRGRPTRPMRMPMGAGPPMSGMPPRGFRGIRPRFSQF